MLSNAVGVSHFLLRGATPYSTGAPHIQNVTLISDHSLAALPFRHSNKRENCSVNIASVAKCDIIKKNP